MVDASGQVGRGMPQSPQEFSNLAVIAPPPNDVPDVTHSKRRLRVYEKWQGNETFFCGGRLVAGPNWKATLGTAALLAAPAGIFLGFVAPYLSHHVHVVLLVFACILPALSLFFLFMTACRDPGIIPRQEPDQEFLDGRKARTKEVVVNNQRVVIRYNDTCHFYQPPRAHHCSVNDNCVERFDHHCPWVGTTVGRRNYRSFLLFVNITTILCLYVIGCSLAQLFVRHNELVDRADAQEAAGGGRPSSSRIWLHTARDCGPALALMGYCFLFFWFVGGLSGFHAYLVARNQTTYENFRYSNDARPNPYNLGILRNCAEVYCTLTPPSQVQFRAYLDSYRPQPPVIPGDILSGGNVSREHSDGSGETGTSTSSVLVAGNNANVVGTNGHPPLTGPPLETIQLAAPQLHRTGPQPLGEGLLHLQRHRSSSGDATGECAIGGRQSIAVGRASSSCLHEDKRPGSAGLCNLKQAGVAGLEHQLLVPSHLRVGLSAGEGVHSCSSDGSRVLDGESRGQHWWPACLVAPQPLVAVMDLEEVMVHGVAVPVSAWHARS